MSEEREPILSDQELTAITKRYPEVNGDTSTSYDAGDEIRDWYEAKITSGELMVVRTVTGQTKGNHEGMWLHCSGCNEVWSTNAYAHCPGCGAKIAKQ